MAKDHIEHVRTLITMQTQLRAMPEWWLRYVEHRITRTPKTSTCWYWDGMLDGGGEPIVKLMDSDGKRRVHQLKRIIAAMFWDLKPHYEILHSCGNTNCLHPKHFYVTAVNWQQHNRVAILGRLRSEIRRMK